MASLSPSTPAPSPSSRRPAQSPKAIAPEGPPRAAGLVGPLAGVGVWVLPGGLGTGRFKNFGSLLFFCNHRLFLVFPIAKGRPIGQIYHHRRAAPRCAACHSSSRCPRRPHSGRGQALVRSSKARPWASHHRLALRRACRSSCWTRTRETPSSAAICSHVSPSSRNRSAPSTPEPHEKSPDCAGLGDRRSRI